MIENLDIKHDVDKHLFFVKVKGGNAELKYDRHKSDYLDFKETFVPSASRERGVGSALVKHALQFAKQSGLKVKPSCPFVADFIEDHPEYQDIKY
ncbi:MAG: GNAT family N-acetyltransferase [Fulvivirga sp.]|nr:GNAT family N-acetyltransferase [Fulvivirga sp.]